MRVVLFGPPGVGKGTQSQLLEQCCGLCQISTGELIRAEMRMGTHAGIEAKPYLDAGKLVPGPLVREMAEHAISELRYDNFILDGYPRTVEQAEWLDEFLRRRGVKLDAVISIKVATADIVDRLSKRRINALTGETYHLDFKPPPFDVDPSLIVQRSDDSPEAIRRRLSVYDRETEPVEAYYADRPVYYAIDGLGDVQAVHQRIRAVLENAAVPEKKSA